MYGKSTAEQLALVPVSNDTMSNCIGHMARDMEEQVIAKIVANLASSISTNDDGVRIVQMAASRIETLCPQVINAALALASKPKSQAVKQNMEVYRQAWETHVRLLTEAVDDVTSIDDFLAVSGTFPCLVMINTDRLNDRLKELFVLNLDQRAGAIRGRAARVAHVVTGEMDNYEPGVYTDGVMKNVNYLTENAIPEFVAQVSKAMDALNTGRVHQFDDNLFVDVSKKVYDSIHDIRCSVLMIRTPEELEDLSDLEEEYESRSRTSVQTDGKTDRAKMTQLPESEKIKIAEQVADFKKVKSKLDAEIEIWDDTSNDIIVLAKKMCMIMMEMTDFTRGKGPLKHTSDVINAAMVISEAGCRMDVLARQIANQCPDPSCKHDLLAYLEQIKLYSHQLKICSQVKSEIQSLGGELITSAVSKTVYNFIKCDASLFFQTKWFQFQWLDITYITCVLHQILSSEKMFILYLFINQAAKIHNAVSLLLQLDSVTSLIQAAKNLMNAVVQTVKMSYIASTKIIRIHSPTGPRHPVVMWRMKAPEKKPLIKKEKPEEAYAVVRKGSTKKKIHPLKVMSEFRGRQVQ
ncbi:CTNA3 protein, partial [Atractosteus spatula]|nr:CTNA3 protein [Atractosteus spatula]